MFKTSKQSIEERSYQKICWCCLKSEEKMNSLWKSPLGEAYSQLIGMEIDGGDSLSQWLCLLCSREIEKARKFQACAKMSFRLLTSLQSQQNGWSKSETVCQQRQDIERQLSAGLSQSILELWCTPDCENDDNYNTFDAEELDTKDFDPNSVDYTKLLLDLPDENSVVIKKEPDSPEYRETYEDVPKIKVKKSKKHKKKKKNSNTSKLKSNSVIKQNRCVVETMQYKVIRLTNEQVLEEKRNSLLNPRYVQSPYKCEHCVKGFNYEEVLKSHMSKHEPRDDYVECKICCQYLPTIRSLRDHAKSHYVRYKCRECDEIRVSRQHLMEHHSLQHNTGLAPIQYTCEVCGKTMYKRTMFQKHIKQHNPGERLPCDKCDKSFKSIATLRAHKITHGDDTPARHHAQAMKYKCPDCPKEFRYASVLESHRVSHASTRNYYCVECDLCFKTQNGLQIHLNKTLRHIDPESLRYKCNNCDKRYANEKQLQQHVDYSHLGKKLYECQMCNKKYATKDSLRSHNRKVHPPFGVTSKPAVANHVCDVCSKAFMTKSVLLKHIRTHTGERPYQCAQCLRSFSQKSTLCTHIKLLHENKRKRLEKTANIDNSHRMNMERNILQTE